jgi:formiminoglutamase
MLADYFEPVHMYGPGYKGPSDCLGSLADIHSAEHFPELEGAHIAIFGVGEERGTRMNKGCALGADAVRSKFYELKNHLNSRKIIDLGNLRQGDTLEDTYAAVSTVISELLPLRIIPVLIGGSQDLTYGQYAGFKKLEQIINIVSIDSRFDLGKPEEVSDSESFLGRIILEQPNYLFNFSNIGYQTYFTGQEGIELMKKLYFDACRLGQIRTDITEGEPVLRNADLVTVDMSAIRQSDAPGNAMASPNGFYGEEICQLMLYAGVSDKLSALGIYEYNPMYDRDHQTAHLMAQMIWYFIEGVGNRKADLPSPNASHFITYRVAVENLSDEITFLKSKKSDRWWMRLPLDQRRSRYQRHHMLPCSYKDYQQACNNEVPDRWWNALQKLV